MHKELIQAISDSVIRLHFLVGTQFIKPIKEMDKECGAFPHGYVQVMRWIMSRGNTPVSMTDLAMSACISKPNLTTMIDRLCVEGFVERSADVNDRRIVNVALTQRGIDYVYQQKVQVASFVEDKLSLLDEPDLEKLKRALNDIMDILREIEDKQK